MARIMMVSYLDVVAKNDTSNLSDEEFRKQLEEEREEAERKAKAEAAKKAAEKEGAAA